MDKPDIAFRFSVSELEQYRGAIHRIPDPPRAIDLVPSHSRSRRVAGRKITAAVLIVFGLFALVGSARLSRIRTKS